VDIEKVSDWLGLGTGASMTCPGCGATKGYDRVPGANVTKCHHNTCSTKGNPNKPGARTAIDLVMEAKRVSAKNAVNLLAAQFGFAPLCAKGPAKNATPPAPPPGATGAPWEAGLLSDDKGRALSTGANAELVLMNDGAWAGVLGYNELRNAVVFLVTPPTGFLPRRAGDIWRDEDDVACCHWLARSWKIFVNETRVRGVVSLVAHRNSFHPVRDELRSYVWDGVARVDTWLSTYLGVGPSPYVSAVGRWWLISAVARVMDPGCKVDTMLILEGPQGARKSSALRALAGGDYFLDDLRDVGGVESAKQLCGKWLVELAELDAFRKAENSTIKRFVSQQSDNYRASYGRTAADYPRQCVFAGTTNHEEYLQDETGARRFWPVLCGTIDVTAIKRDRPQLWAQALALYSAGERWWPETLDEVEMCTREQTERQVEETWAGRIAAFVADKKEVTTRRVLAEALGIELGHMKDAERRRVGAALRGLGWQRSKKRLPDGTQERVFVRPADPDKPLPTTREAPTPGASEFYGPVPILRLVAGEALLSGVATEEVSAGSQDATTPSGNGTTPTTGAAPAEEAPDDAIVLDEDVRVVNYDFMLQ
jgi:hypothetical protein